MGAQGDINRRKASIRRTILKALLELGSGTLDDVLKYPGWAFIKPSREELVSETNELLACGYIENYVPGDYEWVRLTEKGTKQINQEATCDPRIWPGAAY